MINIIEIIGFFLTIFIIFILINLLIIFKTLKDFTYYKMITIIVFIVFLLVGNTFINMFFIKKINSENESNKCDISIINIIYNTIYSIIFVSIPSLLLLYNSNLNSVFSNSLYFKTDLFKDVEHDDKLKLFYQDPILLIQQLEESDILNDERLNDKLKKILNISSLNPKDCLKIKETIMKKELIGYYIWFFFIGSITLIISYNSILLQCVNL